MKYLMPDVRGFDRRGFHVGADVSNLLDGTDLDSMWEELQSALQLFNTTRDPIIALFTQDTTQASTTVPLDTDGMTFEKASEFGQPQGRRAQPNSLVHGFPLEWYDLGLRYTARYLRNVTAPELTTQQVAAQEAANHLEFQLAMQSLLTPVALGSRAVNEGGTQIFSLYAGSTDDVPPSFAGKSFAAGHTHYLVSGATTVDGQDLDDLITHITEHGIGIAPGQQIVIVVNPAEGKVIRGFRAGVNNSPYDFIPSEAAPAYLSTEFIVGDKPPTQINGLPIIGSFGKAVIHESYFMPSGYVAAIATGIAKPALARRSHPRPEQQGLRLIEGQTSYPLAESFYSLGVGYGVQNRAAAAVVQIKGSGSYTPPVVP